MRYFESFRFRELIKFQVYFKITIQCNWYLSLNYFILPSKKKHSLQWNILSVNITKLCKNPSSVAINQRIYIYIYYGSPSAPTEVLKQLLAFAISWPTLKVVVGWLNQKLSSWNQSNRCAFVRMVGLSIAFRKHLNSYL